MHLPTIFRKNSFTNYYLSPCLTCSIKDSRAAPQHCRLKYKRLKCNKNDSSPYIERDNQQVSSVETVSIKMKREKEKKDSELVLCFYIILNYESFFSGQGSYLVLYFHCHSNCYHIS